MTLREDIVADIASLQAKLHVLDIAPVDTYPVGTIARFASNNNLTQWHIIKQADESWCYLTISSANNSSTNLSMSLAGWILHFSSQNLSYFELYILATGATPVYTSS